MNDYIGCAVGMPRCRGVFRGLISACLALISVLPAGCASLERMEAPVIAGGSTVSALPGWHEESASGVRKALKAQCTAVNLPTPWPQLCTDLSALPAQGNDADRNLKQWVTSRFEAWQLTNDFGAGRGLLTGYYEPQLTGSLTRLNDEQVPLYAPPDNLRSADPQLTRARIDGSGGAAEEVLQNKTLLWVDDPVEAFFLHIQGSGRIRLRDGSVVRAGFAAHNGHPYVAIGRELIASGAIPRAEMSAQRIKQWLHANPAEATALMQSNPRYVFFKLTTPPGTGSGPAGSLQVPLTSMRSVATDKRYLPAGSLLYLDSKLPTVSAGDKLSRVGLAVAQDTGGAIRGSVRADLFTGSGPAAGELAGRLRSRLRMWLLWPTGSEPPAGIPVARAVINP